MFADFRPYQLTLFNRTPPSGAEQIRAHKGVDYAAPRGTPIKAPGDGRVTLAGRSGGYGNTVVQFSTASATVRFTRIEMVSAAFAPAAT